MALRKNYEGVDKVFKFLKGRRGKKNVIKLFKIVNYSEALVFKTEKIIDFCVGITNDSINDISWNYGNREWKKYQSFKNFIQNNKKETVDLSLYSNENLVVRFSNGLLNQMDVEKDRIGTIELTIYLEDINFEQEFYSNLFKNIKKIECFDYGYASCMSKKEAKEQGVVVNVHQMDIINNKIFDVKNGYVGDIYSYNLLNLNQLAKFANNVNNIGVLSDIFDDFKLWILTVEEIKKIKSLFSFPMDGL